MGYFAHHAIIITAASYIDEQAVHTNLVDACTIPDEPDAERFARGHRVTGWMVDLLPPAW